MNPPTPGRSARPRDPIYRRTLIWGSAFVVIPLVDLPFINLSVTAPLLLPAIWFTFIGTGRNWIRAHPSWALLALGIGLGMVASFTTNLPLFHPRDFKSGEIALLVQYAFWLSVFVAASCVCTHARTRERVVKVIAVSVTLLGVLRTIEGLAWGAVGAWSRTYFLTQNSYGILFSSFTPFLFPQLLHRLPRNRAYAALALVVILYACAINGSRGSWLSVGLGFAVFVLLQILARPMQLLRIVAPAIALVVVTVAVISATPEGWESMASRWSTMESLETDKSYMLRKALNDKSWKIIEENPVAGVGPGRYRDTYVSVEMPKALSHHSDAMLLNKSAHNSYLSFAAEGGLVTTLPFLALLAVLLASGTAAAWRLARIGQLSNAAIVAGFVSMSLHLWAQAGLTGTHAWFVYGLVAACGASPSVRRNYAEASRRPGHSPRRAWSANPNSMRQPALASPHENHSK